MVNTCKPKKHFALEFETFPDISHLQTGWATSFDTVSIPLCKEPLAKSSVYNRPEDVLTASTLDYDLIGQCSLGQSGCGFSSQEEEHLREQVSYANYLGFCGIFFPYPSASFHNYARVVDSLLNSSHAFFCVRVPLTVESQIDPWTRWNSFRNQCSQHSRLFTALELTSELPEETLLNRWAGEPVKAVVVPTSIFFTNHKGYPALSDRHVKFIHKMARLRASILLTVQGNVKIDAYNYYMTFIMNSRPPLSSVDEVAFSYEDYLQLPLQPLKDNLDSSVYEIFEKDPVKYVRYEEAIYLALLDRVPEQHKKDIVTKIMVVGAGRGPLVSAAIRAGERAQRRVQLFAVEKNPNAIIHLKAKNSSEWNHQVTLIPCDMRHLDMASDTDILVSELLGSFGDNELSPECLDGAQKFLKPDGISIPSSSTSFVAPIHSVKLFNEVKACGPESSFEIPYVVKFGQTFQLAESKSCFTFHHPNRQTPIDNTRYSCLSFRPSVNGLVHGFAGFFESVLYKDVIISTNPGTYSEGMFSWFPLFFPLRAPIPVTAGQDVEFHIWRLLNQHNVWYEWSAEGIVSSGPHNVSGKHYQISL